MCARADRDTSICASARRWCKCREIAPVRGIPDAPAPLRVQVRSARLCASVVVAEAPFWQTMTKRRPKAAQAAELTGDNVDGSTNIVPEMGLEPLRQGYRWLLSQIYSPQLY